MIDTDKYEGHTPAPWHIEYEKNYGRRVFICSKDATILWQCETTHTDALLVADAPLLLEEVKRLREVIVKIDMALMDEDASHLESVELIEAILSKAGVIE